MFYRKLTGEIDGGHIINWWCRSDDSHHCIALCLLFNQIWIWRNIEDLDQAATSIIVSYPVSRSRLPIIQPGQWTEPSHPRSQKMGQIKNLIILFLLAVSVFSCSLLINFFILIGKEGGEGCEEETYYYYLTRPWVLKMLFLFLFYVSIPIII